MIVSDLWEVPGLAEARRFRPRIATNANPTRPAAEAAAKIATEASLGIHKPIRWVIQAATTTAKTVVVPLSAPKIRGSSWERESVQNSRRPAVAWVIASGKRVAHHAQGTSASAARTTTLLVAAQMASPK